jgi:hypothetical protein
MGLYVLELPELLAYLCNMSPYKTLEVMNRLATAVKLLFRILIKHTP